MDREEEAPTDDAAAFCWPSWSTTTPFVPPHWPLWAAFVPPILLMTMCFPEERASWLLSGEKATQYTASFSEARVDLSIPVLDQSLTFPSSPHVARAVPSRFHLTPMQAPSCAEATVLSTLPCLDTSLKEP